MKHGAARAIVWRAAQRAGVILRTDHGSVFEYDDAFHDTIAIHLPRHVQRFETHGTNLHPFFAGLLPEGLRLQALVRRVKTSRDDLLSLLAAAGADTVGDISVLPESEEYAEARPAIGTQSLSSADFSEVFRKSLGTAREPIVPGIQDKVSALARSVPVGSHARGAAFILKLGNAELPHLVENEHFFMRMADSCGLDVARTTLVTDARREAGLLVERFDRHWVTAEKQLRRFHLEDACQFLNRYPADKYVLSVAQIAEGLKVCAAPVPETLRLLRLVAFSYLIGNGDLHAKNISILERGPAGRKLSPAYDLLSTLPYGDRKSALLFDGRDDNLRRKTLIAFGERFEVNRSATAAALDELCDRASPWIERLDEIGFDARRTSDLRRTLTKRRADLR